MTGRLIGSIIVLVSILVLPYWLYIPIMFLAILFFPFFWEGILYGFLVDIIYGGGIQPLSSFVSPFALAALIVIIVFMPIREHLRQYV